MKAPALAFVAVALSAIASGCSRTEWKVTALPPGAVPSGPAGPAALPSAAQASFLKAHTRAGDVTVFSAWTFDAEARRLRGQGVAYDAERRVTAKGAVEVAWDEVVLVETNVPLEVPDTEASIMGLMTGISAVMTVFCVTNPKACFGSCPTFFAPDGRLVAEGFSSSIARSLEATDIDALPTLVAPPGELVLRMTNDALETHQIDSVRLLAARRPAGGRVLRDGAGFVEATAPRSPDSCRVADGAPDAASVDCLPALAAADGTEYKSAADARDLATSETLELSFAAPQGGPGVSAEAAEAADAAEAAWGPALGLAVTGRNSLLNTFLLYQMLAFMGTHAGEWLRRLETEPLAGLAARGIGARLGDVVVELRAPDGTWLRAGVFDEVGPIASETLLVRLPAVAAKTPPGEPLRVRLRMTRGNWRLDAVRLFTLGAAVSPLAIVPSRVSAVGRTSVPDAEALRRLAPGGPHLVSWPGDAYDLRFPIPAGAPELFLESRGFYTEWMREPWLREEDEARLVRLLSDPAAALRELAPAYKAVEAQMDAIFWNSRYAGPR